MEMHPAEIVMKDSYEILDTGNASKGEHVDYHITYRLNDKCNLSCEYCRWYDGDNYDKPLESISALFDFFVDMKFKTVLFYFHGGEAAIHPRVVETLEHMRQLEKDTGIRTIVEFQTSMGYTLNRFKRIVPLVDKLSISYHYVELVKKKVHGMFLENFQYLVDNRFEIERFDVMLENVPDNELEHFYQNILTFLEYDRIVDSEMIHGFCHYEKNPVTKEKHVAFYNKYNRTEQRYRVDGVEYNTNELFAKGINCYGHKCNAGSRDIVLNADGNVFTCGIEMTMFRLKCMPVTPITNVVTDPNYKAILRIRSKILTTCKYEYCGGDFYIPKFGPGNKA